MAGIRSRGDHSVGFADAEGRSDEQPGNAQREIRISGIEWDPEKIVTAAVLEVMPHPNADRLVLCKLDDGRQIHTILTGAPNFYPYKGQGPASKATQSCICPRRVANI